MGRHQGDGSCSGACPPSCSSDRKNGCGAPHPPLGRGGVSDPLMPVTPVASSGATGTRGMSGRASHVLHHPLHFGEQRVPDTSARRPRNVALSIAPMAGQLMI